MPVWVFELLTRADPHRLLALVPIRRGAALAASPCYSPVQGDSRIGQFHKATGHARLEGEHHRLIDWQQQVAVVPLQGPALISLRNVSRAVLASCKTEMLSYGIFILSVLSVLKDSVS
jgi:hypothetical protein